MAKETISLPDIVRILGDRPFPMKETLKEYLKEMTERQEAERLEQEAKGSARSIAA